METFQIPCRVAAVFGNVQTEGRPYEVGKATTTHFNNAWIDQNPTTYTGQIDLKAGEPANIKLLYYNGWFGATAKLRWSSESQPIEFVPTSRLLGRPHSEDDSTDAHSDPQRVHGSPGAFRQEPAGGLASERNPDQGGRD